jgi:predicted AAA+ superfamily ATPase
MMDEKINADLYIYIFGHRCMKYIKEFKTLLNKRDKDSKNDIIYTVNSIGGSRGTDISCLNLQKRSLDSLIFSNNEVGIVRDFINRFNNGNTFYTEKQLTYKTGILLYGKPGTGKSSLVKAIATEYHRGIVQIAVSNIDNIDFSHLTMMINNENEERYIVLFEDIDTLFLNRDESESKSDKDYNGIINKLLQFLDSNSSPNDVIFIATTNHLERLDEALIREGRFDLKLEVDEITKKDVTRFIETFDLDPSLTDEVIETYIEKKRTDYIDKKIKEMEEAKSTEKEKFHFSKDEKDELRETMDLSGFDSNFTRFNQSLMQNIIMSKINKSDKIESVVDTGDIVPTNDEDEEDDEY